MKKFRLPFSKEQLRGLKAGERISVSGTLYTARDQAHKRLVGLIRERRKLPFALKGALLYYCGPTRAPGGKVIGSCGPTTSARMDAYTPLLLKEGLAGAIGKGRRGAEATAAFKRYKAVYFLTYAGCGALLSQCVKKKKLMAYQDLGPEAVYALEVKDFPLIVGIDTKGRSVYNAG